ncbi:UpxY family transcription antiterminator [Chitinophaga nivalis]|uniref:UpxY family transcription antiterminator n=1 Tax=Chitinophaga nivalis TaxID=2991709 RepID=A0ABT3IJ83_9BACT|nr:UpxY family transcription antiterminator [Chitinophaga nivalis]MCW3466328.1 UpxY family transcription antiterminator [Chitinophaga nivalis]MCW3483981.1 UpxY family transcription antiterminator [Chitinophaga nivalis]
MRKFVPGWYIIYTKARYEKKIAEKLSFKGIHAFLPTKRSLRVWNNRQRYVDTPLFPSCIFVFLEDQEAFYGGLSIDGALHYVRAGREVARVPETTIRNIRLVLAEEQELEVSDTSFSPGKQVTMKEGALTDLTVEIVGVAGQQKMLIRMPFLQRNVLVTLPDTRLAAIQ